MAHSNGPMMESLEPRMMLSAATLARDEKLLAAAIVQFQEHQKNAAADIDAARHRAFKDPKVPDPALAPLVAKLQQDKQNRNDKHFANQRALTQAVHADRLLISGDIARIHADQRAGNQTQLTADSLLLKQHRLKLAQDIHDRSLQIETDLLAGAVTLKADRQAIINEIDDFTSGMYPTQNMTTLANTIQSAATKRNTDMKIIIEARLTVAKDKFG